MKSIFEFRSYKAYLKDSFGGLKRKTGHRAAAARHMGCQTAYLSQVLNGSANLSLEQAYALNGFLAHDADESDCLLLLLQKERAGTEDLRDYFQTKLNDLIERRLTIKNRIQAQEGLSPADQTVFYSKWYYGAIHVLLSITTLQTKAALAEHLRLPLATISDALEFLESRGLAVQKSGRFEIGPRHMHLSKDSPHIVKHHTNWRTRAVTSLDAPKPGDMHYSVAMTLSKDDAIKLKAALLKVIDENLELAASSEPETAFAYAIDLFEI